MAQSSVVGRYAVAMCLLAAASAALGDSRLERDFRAQKERLVCREGATTEESCGGTWLKVYQAGREVRKLEWEVEMSMRVVYREFYFSRGKPELVIERSYLKFDEKGNPLAKLELESQRRVWLTDTSGGAKGKTLRKDYREHANELMREYQQRAKEFQRN